MVARKERCDVVVVGGGHNGLVCAALLARAGRRVRVLERFERVGGVARTEEVWPGIELPLGLHDVSGFREDLAAELRLESFGFRRPEFGGRPISLLGGSEGPLVLHPGVEPVSAGLSEHDREQYPHFCRTVSEMAGFLGRLLREDPPDLSRRSEFGQLFRLVRTGLRFRRLGREGMRRFLRTLPLSLADFLDEWFESASLKALLAGSALTAQPYGPMAPGTAALFLYHQIGARSGGGWGKSVTAGGAGALVRALEASARSSGVEIRCGAEVTSVTGSASGVEGLVLSNGEVVEARRVVSTLDPTTTFFGLVGVNRLDPSFVRGLRGIRYRGAMARVQLLLSEAPIWNGPGGVDPEDVNRGPIRFGADLRHLERAADAARRGEIDPEQITGEALLLPPLSGSEGGAAGRFGMSVLVRHLPDDGSVEEWGSRGSFLADAVIEMLSQHATNLPRAILDRRVLTPLDFQERFGLHAGHLYQGEPSLYQAFLLRPVPGWCAHVTPIGGLYLGGSGCHPGPGITGGPGAGAARAVLRG